MENTFKIISLFKSYVSKPEITNLTPNFLVRGSKNVLIDYANRIISRNGYTLLGNSATSGSSGIKSSYEWDTSSAKQFPMRAWGKNLEFYWNNQWNTLVNNLPTPYLEFAKVWDNTEKIDVLLWVLGDSNTYKWSGGATKIASSASTTITKQGVLTNKTSIAFNAGTPGLVAPTITDSANGFLTAGFATGDTLYITGSAANSRIFTIGSVTANTITLVMSDTLVTEAAGPSITLHNGEPTWASSRFLTSGTRKIVYNGVEYTYTGGETTDTLTGLSSFPSTTAGDPVWQNVQSLANPGAISSSFKQDLIAVQLNQVILASTKSQEVYGSATDDYTDFTMPSPRAPADPFKVTMDSYCTCIIPIDNQSQTTSSLMFGAGKNNFFQLSYQLSQDNSTELVRMIKLKTATGSGLISKGAIGNIKNSVAYISREPALDQISNVENNNIPISDPIKNDFDEYDFTDSHIKYWKRALYIALPREGIVLIYDLMRRLWQPPQTIPVGRLAIIDDWLYGHSSVSNETYKLFVGTNDNGVFIPQVARFAYNNGGKRERAKVMTMAWTDGYITSNGVLTLKKYFGFDGVEGTKAMTISGNDSSILAPVTGSPLGDSPLGQNPLGGNNLDPLTNLPGTLSTMLRFYQQDTMNMLDFTEEFTEYTMNTLDGQFALVAYGSDMVSADTALITHTK